MAAATLHRKYRGCRGILNPDLKQNNAKTACRRSAEKVFHFPISCDRLFSCVNLKKGNKKRSGVRSVFCYDIGIIGETVLHRGVRRTVRGCYMPLSEHGLSIRPDCVRCVKYG